MEKLTDCRKAKNRKAFKLQRPIKRIFPIRNSRNTTSHIENPATSGIFKMLVFKNKRSSVAFLNTAKEKGRHGGKPRLRVKICNSDKRCISFSLAQNSCFTALVSI